MTLSSEGVIERLTAEGHAQWAVKGRDVLCAAFTVLLRTFARSVEAASGIEWSVIDRSGQFEMVVDRVQATIDAEYRGWCSFFLRGVDDLQVDAPKAIEVHVTQSLRRLVHGS